MRIRYQQPVQAIGYSTGGASVDYGQIASAVDAVLAARFASVPAGVWDEVL